MTVLIDTCAWIEYLQGSKKGIIIDEYLQREEEVIVSSINLIEIYNYFLRTKPEKVNVIMEFIFEKSFPISVDTEIALQAGKHKAEKKLGMADAIVLATAEKEQAKILTGDNDFRNLPNVIFLEK